MVLFPKNVFALIMSFLENVSKVGRVRRYDEEEDFFSKKKRFRLFKSLFHKNGNAKNMPVVADTLVITKSGL